MKKVLIYSLIVSLFLTGCGTKKGNKKENKDAIKFKEEYKEISIKEKNPIKYSSLDEVLDIMNNKSGLILLCYSESNSCKDNIPVLLEAAYQTGLNKIYYLNSKDLNTDKLDNYINNFDGINVLFVKDKENIGTISSLDENYKQMNDEEKDELLKIYKNSIHEMLDDLCDQSC